MSGRVAGVAAGGGGARLEPVLERLLEWGERVPGPGGAVSVRVPKAALVEAVRAAKEGGFEMISDVFGIDWLEYPGHQGPRFTVAYNLYDIVGGGRLFVRVDVADGESLPTITGLWRAASFMEREVYDMFGIEFDGHPDLRKLLTPEDLEGHPHRKDFPLGETPTLFNDGRFIDPANFRAGLTGADPGLTGWSGGARKGGRRERETTQAHEFTGQTGSVGKTGGES